MGTRAAVVGTVALLVATGLVSGVGAAVTDDTAGVRRHQQPGTSATAMPEQTAGAEINPDTVLLNVALRPDGTAVWTVEYRVLLDNPNTTDAFESVAEDIRTDPSRFTERFGDRMRRTAAAAENETGRPMAIRNVTVETARQQLGKEYGVIRYRFVWTNFAAANETTLRAGDAIGGFFLDSETQLLMTWPENYRPVTVSPNASERRQHAVVWQGRLDFGLDAPRLVVTTRPERGQGPGTGPGSTVSGTSLVRVAVLVVLLVGGGLFVARQRGLLGDGTGAVTTDAETTTGQEASGDAGDATAATNGDDGPPEELLTNEERVLQLLEDRGGRIKQQEVADQLDWTDAKTSQVVKSLREDDEVEVFRLGRENVLSLPDEDDI